MFFKLKSNLHHRIHAMLFAALILLSGCKSETSDTTPVLKLSAEDRSKQVFTELYDDNGNLSQMAYHESNFQCNIVKQQLFDVYGNLIIEGIYSYDSPDKLVEERWDFANLNGSYGFDGLVDYFMFYLQSHSDLKMEVKYNNKLNLSEYPSIYLDKLPVNFFSNPRSNIDPSNIYFKFIRSEIDARGSRIQKILQRKMFSLSELQELQSYITEITKNLNMLLGVGDYCVGFLHILNLAFGYKKPLLSAYSYDNQGIKISEKGIIPIELQDAWLLPTSDTMLVKYRTNFVFNENVTKSSFEQHYDKFENALPWYYAIRYSSDSKYITFLYRNTERWGNILSARRHNAKVMPNSHIAEIIGSVKMSTKVPHKDTLINVISDFRYSLDSLEETPINFPYDQRRNLIMSILPYLNVHVLEGEKSIYITESTLDIELSEDSEVTWSDVIVLDYVHGFGFVRGLAQMILSGMYLPIAVLQHCN